jgi:hypothetical protein
MNAPAQLITGNTYPCREQLRALGGTWDKAAQGWRVPAAFAQVARDIVAAAGPSTFTPRPRPRASRYRSHYTRFASGAEVFTNKNGRCEDAPCCGCCS